MTKQLVNRLTATLTALMLIAIGFVAGNAVLNINAGNTYTRTTPVVLQQAEQPVALDDDEQILADIYDEVSQSVVAISIEENGEPVGSGSGFVIDNEGHIVTNFHVVQGADDVIVNFIDGTITRAEIIGLDPDSDLAVIRVDVPAETLVPVTFGTVDNLVIGQTAVAIGSPFGQRWTMTVGIISALDRSIRGLDVYSIGSAIQTDTPINPGNSGGPLLNLSGHVIGVNSQIISGNQSNSGVGFAIPADLVQRVAVELIETGEVNYSYVGIAGNDINLTIIESLGLDNNQQGIFVAEVQPGDPADRAGLQNAVFSEAGALVSADIITAVDGEKVTNFNSLISYLARNTRPGDTVVLTVLRDGELIDLDLTLASRPGS